MAKRTADVEIISCGEGRPVGRQDEWFRFWLDDEQYVEVKSSCGRLVLLGSGPVAVLPQASNKIDVVIAT